MFQNTRISRMDFIEYLNDFKNEFINYELVDNYLLENSEENFLKFTSEFWDNPIKRTDELKRKYNIDREISYIDILKAFYNDTYLDFLEMVYYGENTLEDISIKFLIPESRVKELAKPIIIRKKDKFCPNCFNNSFKINSAIDQVIDGRYEYNCVKCNCKLKYEELVSNNNIEEDHTDFYDKKVEFNEAIIEVKSILEYILCPECLSTLQLEVDLYDFSYYINCNNCGYMSIDINKTLNDYNKAQKKKEIFTTIRLKEKKLIRELLGDNEFKEINVIKEEIIKVQECKDSIEFVCEICNMDALIKWERIFYRVKLCNRLEKKVLISILELIKEYNKDQIFSFEDNRVLFSEYCPHSPILMEIIEKTKIVTVRNVMRNLIKKGLLIVNEEHNCIMVLPELVENIEIINDTLKVQTIDDWLRYSVIQRNNYTCTCCGETGRPLKVAYISLDKNTNDFNNMVVLCDSCFEIMTKNEILIEATLALENDYIFCNSGISLEFIKRYFPQLVNNYELKKSIKEWQEVYTDFNIIKALAITADKIKYHKLTGSLEILINYTKGILKNSDISNGVIVSEKIFNRYSLNKWLEEA
ncbi:hypothetical protein [Clostridium sp. DL1XJH146]